MEPIDPKWKQQLTNGPFDQDGFTDALRQRIEARLENIVPAASIPLWKRPWTAAASGLAVTLGLVVLVLGGQQLFPSADLPVQQQQEQAPQTAVQTATDYESTVRSALLVGLRADKPSGEAAGEASEYRTLLVAPVAKRLQVAAEGSGILMPYKMDFWRLAEEQSSTPEGGSIARWKAMLANASRSQSPLSLKIAPPKAGASSRSEKLLFVGNRYVAMEQRIIALDDKGGQEDSRYVWVKDVPQLASSAMMEVAPLQQPHVKLEDIFGSSIEPALRQITPVLPQAPEQSKVKAVKAASVDTSGESWTVARQPGRWVAQVASYENDAPAGEPDYQLKELPLALPAEVVSHDKLTPDWVEIKRMQPAAVDAYSSPNLDVVLVVTERHLILYPFQGTLIPSPLLTVELHANESVIMAHWAVDPYVELWKKNVPVLLAQ
ncbi:hypothetical protein [Paenibacillus puerhi]|uniref:hypothetical protein n=1 Tax=Paenibacillus puerhi TaxID=2692622 RepID=UPI00135ABA3B|nr:hypothetical protein [Paenibacillus puerhi]